jgi:hypothetical protein
MSTVSPPAALPADPQTREVFLRKEYLRLRDDCDARAVRYKRWLLGLWCLSMGLTWVPLLLAIAALAEWLSAGFAHVLLVGVMPAAGLANAGVTVAQLVFLFRGRWLKYRAATERLRENCTCFRAGVKAFAGADADMRFHLALLELENQLRTRQPVRLRDLLVGLRQLPEELREPPHHAPDEDLSPCGAGNLVAAEAVLLDNRLRHQQRWHRVKAGAYSRRYLAVQAGIVLLGLVSAVYGWAFGRALAPLAFFYMGSLLLGGFREQMGYASLCLRYLRIAEALERIEKEYRQKAAPDLPVQERWELLQQAAERGEETLASEFRYWYFGRENFGGSTASL